MAKMRNFKFTKEDNEVQTIESSSFKKAVKSFQNQVKQKLVYVEWISKNGNENGEHGVNYSLISISMTIDLHIQEEEVK